jgi:hypothetical protein
MSITKKAADAYALFKKVKKIKTYGTLIKDSVDENTRSGALMKLGIRAMLDLAGKALGTSLTSHPYFTYHKVHLEALAQALNASSNLDKAEEALDRAVRSADAANSLTKALDDYRHRKNGLKLTYAVFIAGSLNLLRDQSNPRSLQIIKDAGQTPQSLQATVDRDIYEWRANWCDVYLDSIQLLTMAEVERRATEAAMQRFDEKMKALNSGGNMGKIAAYRVEQDRQWQEFDRATKPGTGSVQAVEDPAGYARDQVNTIQQLSDALGEGCEAAMSDDAYNPDAILHSMHDI